MFVLADIIIVHGLSPPFSTVAVKTFVNGRRVDGGRKTRQFGEGWIVINPGPCGTDRTTLEIINTQGHRVP